MWFILFVGPIILFFIFVALSRINNTSSKNNSNSNYTSSGFDDYIQRKKDIKEGRYQDNFEATDKVGGIYTSYIEINTKEKKWRINVDRLKDIEVPIYDFSDLRDFELLTKTRNGQTTARTSPTWLGRTMGVNSTKTYINHEEYTDYRIRISFRDLSSPDQYIGFNGSMYVFGRTVSMDLYRTAEDCLSLLRKIKAYNEEQEAKTQQSEAQKNTSVADELIKLKSLLDNGAITQEEFDTQKAKLL